MAADEDSPRPLLRVVKGDPSPEELAALVAVLAARSAAAPPPEPDAAVSPWVRRQLNLRAPLHPGPGAWQLAARVPGTRTRATP